MNPDKDSQLQSNQTGVTYAPNQSIPGESLESYAGSTGSTTNSMGVRSGYVPIASSPTHTQNDSDQADLTSTGLLQKFGKDSKEFIGKNRKLLLLMIIFLLIAGVVIGLALMLNRPSNQSDSNSSTTVVGTLALEDDPGSALALSRRVDINGQLRINNSVIITPSETPANPQMGQLYVNEINGHLYYFDGTKTIDLSDPLSGIDFTSFLNASNLTVGTLSDSRLSQNVTVQGNDFNGANQLLQLNGSGRVDASLLTDNVALLDRNSQVFSGNSQIYRNSANSTTAFRVQNASGGNVLVADTSNTRIAIGQASANYTLDVNGDINIASASAYKIGGVDVCTSLGCIVASSAGILNQNSTDQTADFRISGTGRANTSIQTPLIDTPSATAFNIGTTNATAINLNQNTTVASNRSFTANGTALFQSATDSTTAFRVQNAGGSSLLNIDTTTPNIITNPSFEPGTTGWTAIGSASISQACGSVDYAYVGSCGLNIATSLAGDGASYSLGSLSPSTYYSFTFALNTDLGDLDLSFGHSEDGGLNDIDCATGQEMTGWKQYSCSFITGGSVSSPYVYVKQDVGNVRNIWIDNVQLINGSSYNALDYRLGQIELDGVVGSPMLFRAEQGNTSGYSNAFEIQDTYGQQMFNINTMNYEVGIMMDTLRISQEQVVVQDLSGNQGLLVDGSNKQVELSVGWSGDLIYSPDGSSFSAGTEPASAIANGFMYAITTGSANIQYAPINADGTASPWASTIARPNTGNQSAMVAYNNYIYVMGENGANRNVYYSKINTDGTLTGWSQTTVLPGGNDNYSAVVHNGYMYVASDAAGIYYSKINPNGTVNSWTSSGVVAGDRPQLAVVKDKLYMFEGDYDNDVKYSTINSDGSLSATTYLPDLPMPGLSLAYKTKAVVLNGYIYAFSDNASGTDRLFYASIPDDGVITSWNTSSNYSIGSTSYNDSITSHNGYVYVSGVRRYSVQRNIVAGALDLVGSSAQTLSQNGGTGVGANLTAGNTSIYGSLNVTGQTSLNQGLSIGDSLSVSGDAYLGGSLVAGATATTTTATTSGTGSNTTTVTLTGSAFADGDVIFIDNTATDFYTRITAGGGTSTLTVSPAVSFASGRTVTKYNVQNIGATNTSQTNQADRFYQGSFLGAVTVGANSNTSLSQQLLSSSGQMKYSSSSHLVQATTNSTTAFQIQDANSANALKLDTTNWELEVGGGWVGDLKQNSASTVNGCADECGATILNGYAYVAFNDPIDNQVDILAAPIKSNGTLGTWFDPGPIFAAGSPDFNSKIAVTSYNGYLYVMGGGTDEFWYGRPGADGVVSEWLGGDSILPIDLDNSVATVYNGYIYIAGQTMANIWYAKVNQDGSIGSWTDSGVSSGGTRPTMIATNGYLYLAEGNYTPTVTSIPINSDGTLGATSAGPNLPVSPYKTRFVVANGYIYAFTDDVSGNENLYYAKINYGTPISSWTASTNITGVSTQFSYRSTMAEYGGYIYALGWGTGVYSINRTLFSGALDLVGLSTQNLNEANSNVGGSLIAGNTSVIGNLDVRGQATIGGGLSVGNGFTSSGGFFASGDAIFRASDPSSTSSFQLQDSAGTTLYNFAPFAQTHTFTGWETDLYSDATFIQGLSLNVIDSTDGNFFLTTDSNINQMNINDQAGDLIYAANSGGGDTVFGSEGASVIVNGYAYIVKGGPSNEIYYGKIGSDGTVANYNLTTSIPASTSIIGMIAHNGYLFLVHNGSASVYSAKINRDGTLGAWNSTTSLPFSASSPHAVVHKGYMYVASSGQNIRYAKLSSDGTVGAWTDSGVGSGTRPTLLVAGSALYIFLGWYSGAVNYSTINADGSLSVATAAPTLPIAPYKTRALFVNGHIYAFSDTTTEERLYYVKVASDGTIAGWNESDLSSPSGFSASEADYQNNYASYNGYIYVNGGGYIFTVARTVMGGALDMIGLSTQGALNDASAGMGATLNAGDTNVVGSLNVYGQTVLQSASVGSDLNVGGQAIFRNTDDGLNNFIIQNAGGVNSLTINTVNLLKNSSFEYGVTNLDNNVEYWAKKGAPTSLKRQTSQSYYGTGSMEIVTGTSADRGAKYNISFTPSTQYTLSFYAKLSTGSFNTLTAGRSDDGSTDTNCTLSSSSITTVWARYSCTFTTGATISGTPHIYITKGGDTSARTIYIDGVQLEAGGSATDFRNVDITLDGQTIFKNTADSTTAFRIQSATGANILSVDSLAKQLSMSSAVFSGSILPSTASTKQTASVVSTNLDSTGSVGSYSSLAIGGDNGFPVISYYDITNTDLKVIRCGNSSCSASNTTMTIDQNNNDVGQYTSIAVAPDGLPIISYYDNTGGDLKIAKCGNSNCTSANTISLVDTTNNVGQGTSITIGSDGLPIISYVDVTSADLKTYKCTNTTCSTGTTTTLDSANTVGGYTSITVGLDGYPIISYYETSSTELRVYKCSNVSCTAGSSASVDNTEDDGNYSSIKIGSDGLPIISYYDNTNDDLKFVKCGNSSCSSGNSITTAHTDVSDTGNYTSLVVGTDGLPIISHYDDLTSDNLKVTHCGNLACTSGNVSTNVYTTNDSGTYSSIGIGSDGLPIVAFYDDTADDLRVTKCGSVDCSTTSSVVTGGIDIGSAAASFQNAYINRIVSNGVSNTFAVATNGANRLTIDSTGATTLKADSTTAFQIQNAVGTGLFVGDTVNMILRPGVTAVTSSYTQTFTEIDNTADVGAPSSITVGIDGLPIIAYYDTTNTALRVTKCGNTSCSSGNTSTEVDNTASVGNTPSIAISIDGLPIIAYYDATNTALNVVKCGNTSCSSGNTITQVDNSASVGVYTSIDIGTDGLPVISYRDTTNTALRVTKCGNTSCSSGNTSTQVDNTADVGNYSSVTIGADGFPVISYYDTTNTALRVTKCGNISCSSGNTSTEVDTDNVFGGFTSIEVGTDGLPIISYYYYDGIDYRLMVTKCSDSDCSGNITTTTVDTDGLNNLGQYSSIAIGTDGLPVISYQHISDGDLRVAKCLDKACTSSNATNVETTNVVGNYTSIAISSDGSPIISYYDSTNTALRVTKCADSACSSTSGSTYGGGTSLGSMSSSFGSVYFDTLNVGKKNAHVSLDRDGTFIANAITAKADGSVKFGLSESTTAFQIQNAGGTTILGVDTSSGILFSGIADGASAVGFTLRTSNAYSTAGAKILSVQNSTSEVFSIDKDGHLVTYGHLKSTQTTAPTIGTPANCGTTPTSAVTASSTDSAGSFTITTGTGALGAGTCDTIITFNRAYGTAPKSVVITPKSGVSTNKTIYVSGTSTTTFTVMFGTAATLNSEANDYYYWVVE